MNQAFEEKHPKLRTLREVLNNWWFWVGIAYFGLAAVVVALYINYGNTAEATSKANRQEAISVAATKAANVNAVNQCFTSVKNQPIIEGFADGQLALIDNSLLLIQSAINNSPSDDPLLAGRQASLKRLAVAKVNSLALRALIAQQSRSREECIALAASTDTKIPKQFR